jgi:TPP-dependent pyruvate/acetoin dehydrogenase alpha subunit
MTDIDKLRSLIQSKIDSSMVAKLESYIRLVFVREVELMIAEKYSDQIFRCPVHLSVGQEATAVGVCFNLGTNDKVVSTHRSHAHYLAKGGSLFAMLCELMGKESGCCRGRGGSMHLFDKDQGFFGSVPIVGSSLPIAMGIAFAEKQLQTGNIVVAFVGDAAIETGQFHESLNFASTFELPLLIVIENNGYSTYAPIMDRQPKNRDLGSLIKGYGLPHAHGNGDKFHEVDSLTRQWLPLVRKNNPVVLSFDTYRLYEHCGPNIDDHLGYRPEAEVQNYAERDPVAISKSFGLINGVGGEFFNIIELLVRDFIGGIFQDALEASVGNSNLSESDVWAIS